MPKQDCNTRSYQLTEAQKQLALAHALAMYQQHHSQKGDHDKLAPEVIQLEDFLDRLEKAKQEESTMLLLRK